MINRNDPHGRIVSKLVPWLSEKMPEAVKLSVSDIQKPGMGLSNETYLLKLSWEEKGKQRARDLVLRSVPVEHRVFPDYHLSHQFCIMKALKGSRVPVPEVYWLEEDESVLGSQFYLMERLDGTMPKDYPSYHGSGIYFESSPEDRARMWWGSLETVAEINRVDWRRLGLDFLGVPGGGTGPIDRQIAYWERYYAWIKDDPSERHPVLEQALRWLREHRYKPERVCLCWGDARMGNTLYRVPDFAVLAALDWEMAFLGDPEADLAWFIFLDRYLSEEYSLPRLDGSPDADETIRRYEDLTGWKVRNYRFNEVFSAMRFGMILVSVLKKMKSQGIPVNEEMYRNNACTRHIAGLLDLPAPGEQKKSANIKEDPVTIQFNLSGPGGSDWYIVSDRGNASRHSGSIDNPTCTVRASDLDWQALQTGELNQIEAWKTGRLVVDGDLAVMIQLKDEISRLHKAPACGQI